MSGPRPDTWMPWYIGDYLADTMDLTRDQHGGYMLLIAAYWRRGAPLPDDDGRLAGITKSSKKEWKLLRAILSDFFDISDGFWKHKRIDEELARAAENSEKRSNSGKEGAARRWNKDGKNDGTAMASASKDDGEPMARQLANASQNDAPSPSPSPKKENLSPPTENRPEKPAKAEPGSGGVSGSDEFDLNHHDPADPHAALPIPAKLASDAGAVAAMVLVNEFIRLRKRHWPNESAFPQSTITMIERARPLMADDFPVEIYAEILAQQMGKKVKEGQANAVKSLDFCMLSLQAGRTKYLDAITAGLAPVMPSSATAPPEIARPYEDHATMQWRSRLEGFRDYGAWSQNHGPKPPGLGQPRPRHAEYPEWLAVEVGVSSPAADTDVRPDGKTGEAA